MLVIKTEFREKSEDFPQVNLLIERQISEDHLLNTHSDCQKSAIYGVCSGCIILCLILQPSGKATTVLQKKSTEVQTGNTEGD